MACLSSQCVEAGVTPEECAHANITGSQQGRSIVSQLWESLNKHRLKALQLLQEVKEDRAQEPDLKVVERQIWSLKMFYAWKKEETNWNILPSKNFLYRVN